MKYETDTLTFTAHNVEVSLFQVPETLPEAVLEKSTESDEIIMCDV